LFHYIFQDEEPSTQNEITAEAPPLTFPALSFAAASRVEDQLESTVQETDIGQRRMKLLWTEPFS
jgi:hypothetical protein